MRVRAPQGKVEVEGLAQPRKLGQHSGGALFDRHRSGQRVAAASAHESVLGLNPRGKRDPSGKHQDHDARRRSHGQRGKRRLGDRRVVRRRLGNGRRRNVPRLVLRGGDVGDGRPFVVLLEVLLADASGKRRDGREGQGVPHGVEGALERI